MPGPRRAKPKATRPQMPPEYGILGPTKGKGLLPWSWATERLANSAGHWLATTRPDGRPHVMIVWGVWLASAFYFGTSRHSRKARNLVANPKCVVCAARTDEVVIMEGAAKEVTDPKLIGQFQDAYRRKYQEDIDTSQFPVYAVRPRIAFGFISTADDWAGSVTRWRFPQS